MKMLTMTLKKKWFDMILSGEKKEEYREIKDYWARRFLCAKEEVEWAVWCEILDDMNDPYKRHNSPQDLMAYFGVQFNGYEFIHFINGYGAARPCFDVEIKGFTIKRGNPEWGAKDGTFYFVFQLGRVYRHVPVIR